MMQNGVTTLDIVERLRDPDRAGEAARIDALEAADDIDRLRAALESTYELQEHLCKVLAKVMMNAGPRTCN